MGAWEALIRYSWFKTLGFCTLTSQVESLEAVDRNAKDNGMEVARQDGTLEAVLPRLNSDVHYQ